MVSLKPLIQARRSHNPSPLLQLPPQLNPKWHDTHNTLAERGGVGLGLADWVPVDATFAYAVAHGTFGASLTAAALLHATFLRRGFFPG